MPPSRWSIWAGPRSVSGGCPTTSRRPRRRSARPVFPRWRRPVWATAARHRMGLPFMKLVIVGCGRVGAMAALALSKAGHQVTVIDRNRRAFDRLGTDFTGEMVLGNGIDEDVLRQAGIESADGFASLTNGDKPQIIAAQIALQIFKVPRVITRIYDPMREAVYRELGLNTVCPTLSGARQIHAMLKGCPRHVCDRDRRRQSRLLPEQAPTRSGLRGHSDRERSSPGGGPEFRPG